MKRLCVILVGLFFLWAIAGAIDITMNQRLPLVKHTHINNDLDSDSWDTVFVVITDSIAAVVDTAWLQSNGSGRWYGSWWPTGVGSYVAEYHAKYDDTKFIVEEEYFTVLDSVAFHGAAAGLTAEEIADTLFNRGYVGGAGADTFDLYVFNGDTTAQEGVEITVLNQAHTAIVIPSIETNVNGKAQVFLDADTYHLYLQRLGVIYAEWDTIVVPSGGGIDTIWVASYDPGSAPSAFVVRIKGFNRDLGFNQSDRLKITFRPQYANLIDTAQDVFVTIKEIVAYSDTGFFQVDVIPSVHLLSKQESGDIDSILYDMEIKRKFTTEFERRNIFVPDTSGAIWLKDILD